MANWKLRLQKRQAQQERTASLATAPEDNAFIGLRIAAASAVVFSHHFSIAVVQAPAWLHFRMVGGVAVMVFFTISGYLVTLSWLREPHLLAFAGKRLLRLWPGMFVAIVAGVLLFGPAFTTLPVREFWAHPATGDHWRNLWLVKAYVTLPNVFIRNPLSGLMNGPLWTIPMEVLCYAVLMLVGGLGLLRWRWLASGALVAYMAYFVLQRNADLSGPIQHWFEYPAYFAHGSLIALHRSAFLKHGKHWVLLLAPVAALLFWGFKLEHTAGLLWLAPLIIYLGLQRSAVWTRLQRLGDPSYGIYLLGCPIAQAVYALWPGLPFLVSMALALLLSMAAGYASWHAVESPALRLKRFLPGARVHPTRSADTHAQPLCGGLSNHPPAKPGAFNW